ncbi:MAG: hypothetical protein AAGD14_01910 [Planctomycetota bacterium]
MLAQLEAMTRAQRGTLAHYALLDELVNAELKYDRTALLQLYRSFRRRRQVSEEVGFFLVVGTVTQMIDDAPDPPHIRALAEHAKDIERAHGLGDEESFRVGHGPPEWERVCQRYSDARSEHTQQVFRRHGLGWIADLIRDDEPEYDRIYEIGRFIVYGPVPLLGTGEADFPELS